MKVGDPAGICEAARILITGDHPDHGKAYQIKEIRENGWILTTNHRLFHQDFFELCPLPNSTSAQESGQAFPVLASSLEDLSLSDSVSVTNTAETSCNHDSMSKSSKMLKIVIGSVGNEKETSPSTSLPLHLPVLPSQYRENDKAHPTNGTVSPPLSEQLSQELLGIEEKLSETHLTLEWERSPSIASCICPSCQEQLLKLEDGCGVCGWLPEILLGENSTVSGHSQISPKKNPSGSLYPFLQNKKDKNGFVKTYPKVNEQRDPENPDHWFWGYCWDEKVVNEETGVSRWKTYKRSCDRHKLEDVSRLIADNQPVSEILTIIGPKKGSKEHTHEN